MRRWLGRLFSNKGHRSVTENMLLRQCIRTMIMSLGSLAAVTVTTWAWFSVEVPLGTYQAESTSWGIRIEQNGIRLTDSNVYLIPGARNRFDITAVGKDAEGFCYVMLDGEEYITETLESGDTLTFYVKVRGEIDYEIATASKADYAAATASEADREAGEEVKWSEIELLFIPQLGKSPVESEMALYGLRDRAPILEDVNQLAYVIADGQTLYCGEVPEKTKGNQLVSGQLSMPELESASGQSAATEGESTAGESAVLENESIPDESAVPEDESIPGEWAASESESASGEWAASESESASGEWAASESESTPGESAAPTEETTSDEVKEPADESAPGQSAEPVGESTPDDSNVSADESGPREPVTE